MARHFCRWDPELAMVGLRFSNVMDPEDYAAFPSFDADPTLRKWNLWGYIDARDGAQAVRPGPGARPRPGCEVFVIANADTVMSRVERRPRGRGLPRRGGAPGAGRARDAAGHRQGPPGAGLRAASTPGATTPVRPADRHPSSRSRPPAGRSPARCGPHTNRVSVCRPPRLAMPRSPCVASSAARETCPVRRSAAWRSATTGTASLSAEDRSWVGLVAQAGIAAFIAWFRARGRATAGDPADVFGTAPRELTRSVSLRQTARDGADRRRRRRGAAVESWPRPATSGRCARRCCATPARSPSPPPRCTRRPPRPAAPGTRGSRRSSSTPCCPARPTTAMQSRAAALGWGSSRGSTVVARQHAPGGRQRAAVDGAAPAGRPARLDVLAGVQGRRLVVILGGSDEPLQVVKARSADTSGRARRRSARPCPTCFAAGRSARAALAGLAAAPAWPDAPRPVCADDLLPERALAGDPAARGAAGRRDLPPAGERGHARSCETATAYLESGSGRWRRRPACCSSTPTPCATGSARDRRRHRLRPRHPARRLHRARSPSPWAGSPSAAGHREHPHAASETPAL